ncbi:ABC transporter C family member 5, partial [Mucuna pruriens]
MYDYHTGTIGHTTERCWGLKHKVQDLMDARLLSFENSPNTGSNSLPNHEGRLGGFASTTIQLLGIVGVMTEVTWHKYYMASSRELVCIVSIQKSPILHLFDEPIVGASTNRGFGQEKDTGDNE